MDTFIAAQTGAKSSSLLVIFNGWGMDEYPLLPFLKADCRSDCLILSAHHQDYSELVTDRLKEYERIDLIAFSLGVSVAHSVLAQNQYFCARKGLAIAVNGSLDPISSLNGIDPQVFATMLGELSAKSVLEFQKKMCRKEYGVYEEHSPQRSFQSQKDELAYLFQNIRAVKEENSFFDLAIISKADMIIPAKAQSRYWQHTVQYKIAAPHFPFSQLQSIWNIIEIAKSFKNKDFDAGKK